MKQKTIKFKALIIFSNSINSIKKDLQKILENSQIFSQEDLDLKQSLLFKEKKKFLDSELGFINLKSNLDSLILSISGTLKFYENDNFGKDLSVILNILNEIKIKGKINELTLLKNSDFSVFSSKAKFLDTKFEECLLILNQMQKNNLDYFEDKNLSVA